MISNYIFEIAIVCNFAGKNNQINIKFFGVAEGVHVLQRNLHLSANLSPQALPWVSEGQHLGV